MVRGASRNSSAPPCSPSSPKPHAKAVPSNSRSRKSMASSAFWMAKSHDSPISSGGAMNRVSLLLAALLAALLAPAGPAPPPPPGPPPRPQGAPAAYILGPDDQILIRVVDIEEVPDKPVRIDMRGNINLPIVGRIHAGGLSGEQLDAEPVESFPAALQTPAATVFVAEFRSQPVS